MGSENTFILHAMYIGFYITFVYDLLRIFRRVIPHKAIFVSIEDLLFWVYCSITVFLLLYREGNGTLRWFAVAGALVGMLLYKKLFSGLLVNYLSKFLQKLLLIVKKITSPVVAGASNVSRKGARMVIRTTKRRLTIGKKLLRMNLRTRERKTNGKKKSGIPKKATE